METFLLMTKKGTRPPKYRHHDIASAVAEAKRLNNFLQDDVEILKVVGKVRFIDVPVTRRVQELQLDLGLSTSDDLPF
jgi:hypothetical protein